MKKEFSNKLYILIFLLPALILFCGVLIAPIGASAYYSLFNWNPFFNFCFYFMYNRI